MKHILLPTDFSPNSDNALEFALNIASHLGARLTVISAYQMPIVVSEAPVMSFDEKKDLDESLAELGKRIKQSHPDLNVKYESTMGDPVQSISRYAEEQKPDLIIMGTMGARSVDELIFGTHTSAVISKTTVPVLAVPNEAKWEGINDIVFATNILEFDYSAVKQIQEFVQAWQGKLTILHVFSKDDPLSEQDYEHHKVELSERFNYSGLEFVSIEAADAQSGIEDYVNKHRPQILAILTMKRNLFERVFNPGLTRSFVFHSHVPVFAFHE